MRSFIDDNIRKRLFKAIKSSLLLKRRNTYFVLLQEETFHLRDKLQVANNKVDVLKSYLKKLKLDLKRIEVYKPYIRKFFSFDNKLYNTLKKLYNKIIKILIIIYNRAIDYNNRLALYYTYLYNQNRLLVIQLIEVDITIPFYNL